MCKKNENSEVKEIAQLLGVFFGMLLAGILATVLVTAFLVWLLPDGC